MVGKYNVMLILTLCMFSVSGRAEADSNKWEDMSGGIAGRILCIKGIEGTDVLYAGTETGFYSTKDGGGRWQGIDLPCGSVFDVRDIAVAGEDIFIATGKGVYTGPAGVSWKRLPGRQDIAGVVVPFEKRADSGVFAWSGEGFFRIRGRSWKRTGPELLTETIDDAACRNGSIFITAGGDLFCSSDGGELWKKISLLKEYGEEETDETDAMMEEEKEFSITGNIDPSGPAGVVIATTEGLFILSEEGRLLERVDTTGLPKAYVRYAAWTEKGLFAATDKRVFLYSGKAGYWQPFFERTLPGYISFLKGHRDGKGRRWLWVACGEYLYRRAIDFIPENSAVRVLARGSGRNGTEPSIRDVHRMAIEYAEVSPEKIKRWRRGAEWKAIMPKVSLSFSESRDDNIEIYKNSTKSYIVEGPREIDTDWGIGLTWDLSDLVWNDSQTNIDIRSKLMVQLRDNILEEVTRLYFERKRLLAGMLKTLENGKECDPEKQVRIEELTAYIDALTGGKFSETIKIK
ncbi:MAG: hypothetical protein DRP85_04410 [Candidatus Makaraimicrobium thalassicum]|nr:MAG: hypothetical protein DRP85_04410 [Candidatus Omnitrophota bacterium]